MSISSEVSLVHDHHTRPAVLGRAVRVSRYLDQTVGWLKELSTIYREARRGELAESSACRLTYIASVGARMAKDVQELKEVEAIRAQLERLGAAPPASEVTIRDDSRDVVAEWTRDSF